MLQIVQSHVRAHYTVQVMKTTKKKFSMNLLSMVEVRWRTLLFSHIHRVDPRSIVSA